VGKDRGSGDRVDFTAFAHQPLRRDAHESDQAEISYFLANSPDHDGYDLVRRMDKYIDDDPQSGGVVQVLAENVVSFEVTYLDPLTNQWVESWDSTQPAAQLARLPAQVWIVLLVADGPGGEPVTFQTKIPIPMQLPLMFADPNAVPPTPQ
jgi:general secretion pathway protein J